jgi:RimJ/RimL family protein N-acetyltransferase
VPIVKIRELRKEDLGFLLSLWHEDNVMRYADEFPRMRGWTKNDTPETAWRRYEEVRTALGGTYCQLMLLDEGGTLIGEAFTAPFREGAAFGKWQKPEGIITLFGDIKLMPANWGRGLGTEGMKQVVRHRFTETNCGLFCVPPNRKNPPAFRVYQKAGFELFTGMRSYRNHQIMQMTRARYEALYGDGAR